MVTALPTVVQYFTSCIFPHLPVLLYETAVQDPQYAEI
jgi:hypothetical protein